MSMTGRFLRLTRAELQDVIARPALAADLAYPNDAPLNPSELDIDKAWHIIHFLLTGEAWGGSGALADSILGGVELTGTDAGYGPFRYLTPPEVQSVARALADLPFDELWSRLDPDETESAGIYPGRWGADGEVERAYVAQNYESLRTFYSSASQSSSAVLLYLS